MIDRHDKHYKECCFEPLSVIKNLLSHDEYVGFIKGNIIKYRLRAGHKGIAQEDIDKALVYESLLKAEDSE